MQSLLASLLHQLCLFCLLHVCNPLVAHRSRLCSGFLLKFHLALPSNCFLLLLGFLRSLLLRYHGLVLLLLLLHALHCCPLLRQLELFQLAFVVGV